MLTEKMHSAELSVLILVHQYTETIIIIFVTYLLSVFAYRLCLYHNRGTSTTMMQDGDLSAHLNVLIKKIVLLRDEVLPAEPDQICG